MKNTFFSLLFVIFFSSFCTQKSMALSPKGKAFLFLTMQGTAAGALLGAASIPLFDTEPKSIFVGASLGLYTGILFGAYVIWSHSANDYDSQYYEDDGYGDQPEDGGSYYEEDPQRFSLNFYDKRLKKQTAPVYFNLVKMTF